MLKWKLRRIPPFSLSLGSPTLFCCTPWCSWCFHRPWCACACCVIMRCVRDSRACSSPPQSFFTSFPPSLSPLPIAEALPQFPFALHPFPSAPLFLTVPLSLPQDGRAASSILIGAMFIFCNLYSSPGPAIQLLYAKRPGIGLSPSHRR